MAYVLTGHILAGPFADKAGEFCGNYHPDRLSEQPTMSRQQRMNRGVLRGRLARQFPPIETHSAPEATFDPTRHLLGLPHATAGQTVKELWEAGWRGKYLIADDDAYRGVSGFSSGVPNANVIGTCDGHIILLAVGPDGRYKAADRDDNARCPWIRELVKTPKDLAEPDVNLLLEQS
jgi:hypothetical protein